MRRYIARHKGLTALTLVFSTLFSVGTALTAIILRNATDVAASGDMDQFYSQLRTALVFFAGLGILYYIYALASKRLICQVTRRLRGDVFSGIFRRNMGDFRQVNSADYLSALTNDMKLVEDNYFLPLLLALQSAIVFLASLGVMIYMSPLVTGFLLITLVLLILVPGLMGKPLQRRQDRYSKALSALTVKAKDLLSGFDVIRAYGMTDHSTGQFEAENRETRDAKLAVDNMFSLSEAVSMLLGVTVQVGVVFLSAYLLIQGRLTAGAILGLTAVSGQIVSPIQTLSQNLPKLQGAKPVIDRLTALADYGDGAFTGTAIPRFTRGVALEGVSFSYDGGVRAANGLSAEFYRGGKYAVVGRSGCGKTTMAALMTGQYAGYTGEIRYDGRSLRELDIRGVEALTALVHQNTYMFDASIRDNICLHRAVPEEELRRALSVSGVDTFLDGERGLDAPVGENGAKLSGGQRQRIAVARALVQKKPILILDEGTSAVDRQTACDIEARLLRAPDLTLITITHALEPELLGAYDQVLYMEDGAVRERGTFGALAAGDTAFARFCAVKLAG